MLKCKRRPIADDLWEPWLDYHIRSLRAAAAAIQAANLNVLDKLTDLKRSWAGHIARFGIGPREAHPLKQILAWRPYSWWHEQSLYNDLNWSVIRHAPSQGRPRRWDQQFSSNWLSVLAAID